MPLALWPWRIRFLRAVAESVQPKIDVRIAYEPGGRLGADCNRIMCETLHDWVLFVDHDVYLALNPNWYTICQRAIIDNPCAGVLTCWSNCSQHKYGQHYPPAPRSNDITKHIDTAASVYREQSGTYAKLDHRLALFFLLVRVEAWRKAGCFPARGMFQEDWTLCKRVIDAGYQAVRINGLYVYHGRFRTPSLIDGDKTTAEHWRERQREKDGQVL